MGQDPQQAAASLSLSATGSLKSLGDVRRSGKVSSPCGSEHCIAAAAISLNALRALAGGERVLEVLCSSAEDLLSKEAEPEGTTELTTPHRGALLWQEAGTVVKATCSEKVYEFLTSLRRESEQLLYLLPAYLRLSTVVLGNHEIRRFLQFLVHSWWVPKVKQSLLEIGCSRNRSPSIGQENLGSNWDRCVQLLCLIHLVQSVHACICTHVDENSTSIKSSLDSVCEEWLCLGVLLPDLRPLAGSTPQLLHTAYQGWLEDDQRQLGTSTIPATTHLHTGLILRVSVQHRLMVDKGLNWLRVRQTFGVPIIFEEVSITVGLP